MKILYALLAMLLGIALGAFIGILVLCFYLVTHDFIFLGLAFLFIVIIAALLVYIASDSKPKRK